MKRNRTKVRGVEIGTEETENEIDSVGEETITGIERRTDQDLEKEREIEEGIEPEKIESIIIEVGIGIKVRL